MLDQSSLTARSGALPQQAAGQRHFSLDSVCPGTEPSRSLRLHLTLVLSGPSSGVVQTAPSWSCADDVLLGGKIVITRHTKEPQHV